MNMLKLIIIITSLIFISCHSQLQAQNIDKPNNLPLPTDSVVSIPYKIIYERHAFEFDDRDNNRKYLAGSDGYDENHNLIEHLEFRSDGNLEQHIVYIYLDKRLKEKYRFEVRFDETLFKTIYLYQPDGKLFSTITFNFTKRIKKDADKGLGRPQGDIIWQSDYEKTKSWEKGQTEIFSYDSNENLIEKKTIWPNSEETETYRYNSQGQVIEELTLSDERVTRRITTSYFTDSIKTECIFTDMEDASTIGRIKYDKNNNEIDDMGIEKSTGNLFYRRLYTYDLQNRVIKQEYITNLGTSIFTLYEYTTNSTSVKKEFTVNNR